MIWMRVCMLWSSGHSNMIVQCGLQVWIGGIDNVSDTEDISLQAQKSEIERGLESDSLIVR